MGLKKFSQARKQDKLFYVDIFSH